VAKKAAVLWQASIVVCIALVVGVPLGIIGGRLIWSTFSKQVGVPAAGSVVPWVILAIVALGIALVADFAALAPAAAAARTKTATVIRSE
jgi:putative ABC transport system permease protein